MILHIQCFNIENKLLEFPIYKPKVYIYLIYGNHYDYICVVCHHFQLTTSWVVLNAIPTLDHMKIVLQSIVDVPHTLWIV